MTGIRYIRTGLWGFYLLSLSWLTGQEYAVGDIFALEHQQMSFEICANGDGAESMQIIDYNYLYNGGEQYVIWLDIFASD